MRKILFLKWVSRIEQKTQISLPECLRVVSAECEGTKAEKTQPTSQSLESKCRSRGREVRLSDSMCVRHDHYHLLIVEDGLEPEQVLLLEWHQNHKRSGLIMRSWVSNSRLWVEEPQAGLAPNVGFISFHWRIVEPEVQIKYYLKYLNNITQTSFLRVFSNKTVSHIIGIVKH